MLDRKRDEILYSSFQSTKEGKEELYHSEKNKIKDINHESNYNSLTGLPVLRLFYYRAGEIVKEHPEERYAVIVMDITQFKAVNEFLGRKEGDRLLKFIAECLNEYVKERPFTVAGHLRADNFCLFTAYRNKQELADIAVAIQRRIKTFPFAYRVIISFGICASEEVQPAIPYLKDCATLALSEVKGKYYADYNFFTEEMRTNMLREKLVESDMMEALEKGEIVPYVQPKVNMVTGRIVGGEALVRWLSAEKGMVSPGEFIPIIEKTGLVIKVDKRVWSQVFQYQKRVLDEGRSPVPISINVSRMHIYDASLSETFSEMCDRYGVPAGYVPLELTESAFTGEKNINSDLVKLRNKGFVISMDDFGSGYSSLNMLKGQEFDEVKIDKEFLSDISGRRSKVVIRHLLAMLQELGVNIIVEGIETEEQRDFFVENGCRRAQGFWYYKPMPLEEFDELLRTQSKNSGKTT